MEKTAKTLIANLQALADTYRALAQEHCSQGDAFGVYQAIKETIAIESKIRNAQRRYLGQY